MALPTPRIVPSAVPIFKEDVSNTEPPAAQLSIAIQCIAESGQVDIHFFKRGVYNGGDDQRRCRPYPRGRTRGDHPSMVRTEDAQRSSFQAAKTAT